VFIPCTAVQWIGSLRAQWSVFFLKHSNHVLPPRVSAFWMMKKVQYVGGCKAEVDCGE
jgi:hypothetical protein